VGKAEEKCPCSHKRESKLGWVTPPWAIEKGNHGTRFGRRGLLYMEGETSDGDPASWRRRDSYVYRRGVCSELHAPRTEGAAKNNPGKKVLIPAWQSTLLSLRTSAQHSSGGNSYRVVRRKEKKQLAETRDVCIVHLPTAQRTRGLGISLCLLTHTARLKTHDVTSLKSLAGDQRLKIAFGWGIWERSFQCLGE